MQASEKFSSTSAVQFQIIVNFYLFKILLFRFQEFYIPMHTAGLLNLEQLHTIFLNLDELLDINDQFADKLQDLVELANEQGDEVGNNDDCRILLILTFLLC